MKKKYQRVIVITLLFTILIFYLLNSSLVIKGVLEYTELFINKLFPVSFIFFVFSYLFIDYGIVELISSLFHINGSKFYVVFMSLISGFPSGAKYTVDLLNKGFISEKEANYLIKFTHFPNPLFILGAVLSILDSKYDAFIMLITLILSNFVIAFVFRINEKNKINFQEKNEVEFSTSLSKAIISTIKVLINIYGISVFFYLIVVIICSFFNLSIFEYVLLNGLFDLTKGVFSTSLITNYNIRIILILFFISFGSISIHMQVNSIISDTNIKYKNFFIGRFLQAIIAPIIFFILKQLF